jgi:hypothetical protein
MEHSNELVEEMISNTKRWCLEVFMGSAIALCGLSTEDSQAKQPLPEIQHPLLFMRFFY